MDDQKMDYGLPFLNLLEGTAELLNKNKYRYHKAAALIVNRLHGLFQEKGVDILGINYRIKSDNSLKEKIIRRKLYKYASTPEGILDSLSDLIGVMVECHFIDDEKTLFYILKKHFCVRHENSYYCSEKEKNFFIDLDMPQPTVQKNGNLLYKLDCFYMLDGRINFEIQIKSLVNTFWSEVEHSIVYKNNNYIPEDDYIPTMLESVRMNLLSQDKILHLVSSRINSINTRTAIKDLEMNQGLATKLISDFLNAKMEISFGFTVDVKVIRDLLAQWLMEKAKSLLPFQSFYYYSARFRNLYGQDVSFTDAIDWEGSYRTDSPFRQTLGDKLISAMNKDFEWHVFFTTMFLIDSDNTKCDSFDTFLQMVETLYCGPEHFETLYERFSAERASAIEDDIKLFAAEGLGELTQPGIRRYKDYKKGAYDLAGFLQHQLSSMAGCDEWPEMRMAFRSAMHKTIRNFKG